MINVILADHQRIFRIGMASALSIEDDIRVVGQPYSVEQLLLGLENFRAHVLVLSSAFLGKLAEIKRAAAQQRTAILLLEEPGSVILPQFSPEVNGVMQRSADKETALRCIRHLARGGRVLRFVPNQPDEVRPGSSGLRLRPRLSQLELRIIALVVQGYRNREIATQLGSTEQGIKNSLRKTFDKTGVSDRLELALFVLHHRIVVPAATDAHLVSSPEVVTPINSPGILDHRRAVNY